MLKLEKLQKVVLNVLGKDKFETNADGHLVLSEAEKSSINAGFKFSDNFAESFAAAFNEQADGKNKGEDVSALDALNDAMKIEVANQVKAGKKDIEKELQKGFDAKVKVKQDALDKLQGEKTDLETTNSTLEGEKKTLEEENKQLSGEDETEKTDVTVAAKTKANATAFKADKKLFHNQMAFEYIENGRSSMLDTAAITGFANAQMGGGANDTIDVSEINTEFGVYLTGTRKIEIFRELLRSTGSRNYMTKKFGLERWRASQSQITEVVQQFIAKWTPKGGVKFTPIEIINRRHKVNLPIVPDDITGGWLTYMYNEGLTPDKMPVVKYVIEELLRQKIDDDIEFSMIAEGAYEALADVTEGDAGQSAAKAMDGFITILTAELADVGTKVNFYTPAAAFSHDTSIAFFDGYGKAIKAHPIGKKLHSKGMNIFSDPDMVEEYRRKYRDTYPTTKNEDKKSNMLEFTNLTFVELENMRGTGVVFSTPKSNFIELHHRNEAGGATKLFLQLNNYEVRIFAEFWLAVGFAIAEFVFSYVPPAV